MSQEELEKKQQEAMTIAFDIARLTKILGIKQSAFNKLDKEIYEAMKAQEETTKE